MAVRPTDPTAGRCSVCLLFMPPSICPLPRIPELQNLELERRRRSRSLCGPICCVTLHYHALCLVLNAKCLMLSAVANFYFLISQIKKNKVSRRTALAGGGAEGYDARPRVCLVPRARPGLASARQACRFRGARHGYHVRRAGATHPRREGDGDHCGWPTRLWEIVTYKYNYTCSTLLVIADARRVRRSQSQTAIPC